MRFIREMAGVSVMGKKTEGELTKLDLSEAQIVSGGDYYYQDYNDTKYYTKDDELGICAFSNCSGLKNLTISKEVSSIKDIAFNNSYDNLELESVYVAWENPIEAGSFFDRINISNCTLYVPQGTKEAYANADVWKDFGNIIEYDATGIDKVTNRSDVNIVVYSDGSIKKVAVQ